MNVLIAGGGLVGHTLAEKLIADGHDVSIVDRDPVSARELDAALDVLVVVGDATKPSVLERAGVKRANLLIAATSSDSDNVLVGAVAANLYEVERVIVRVREPEHADTFGRLVEGSEGDHACVNPEAAAVDRVIALLEVPGALDVVTFLEDSLLVAGFRVTEDSDLRDLTLAHLGLMFPDTPTLALAIHRGDVWVIPGGEDEIRLGDVVYFSIPRESLEDVLALLGVLETHRKNVMIAGATRMGLAIARRLEQRAGRVLLIEENAERAHEAADQLSTTLVVHGRVTERAILEEEDVGRVGTFVAVLPDHEENLVSSLLAKRLGAARAFSLVDNPALANLIGEVGIDAIISPRLLAVGLLLQRIRRGRVVAVEALLEDKVEIVEAEAVEGCRLVSGSLGEVGLPRGAIVAAVRRGERLLVPGGSTTIEAGDQFVIVASTEAARQLDAFLAAS